MTSDVVRDRDATVETTGAPEVRQYAAVRAGRDRVRWGPVVAGLLTALTTFILLSLLATALGIQAVRSGADARDAGTAGAITAAIIGLISFFVGGYVAAWAARSWGREDGALNGFLVWALSIPLVLLLAGLGLGGIFGALGDQFGNYRDLGGRTQGVDPATVADAIRNGALGAFLGMLLPAIAAAAGGWLGAREEGDYDVERTGRYRMERG